MTGNIEKVSYNQSFLLFIEYHELILPKTSGIDFFGKIND